MINWALMTMVILLVLVFGSSTNLAAAYGIAVTGAMFIRRCCSASSFLAVEMAAGLAVPLLGAFLRRRQAYFGANLMKVAEGGWFPLLVGVVAFTLLTTWAQRQEAARRRLEKRATAESPCSINSAGRVGHRVRGTAVYLTATPDGIPLRSSKTSSTTGSSTTRRCS